MIETCGTNLRV